MDLLYINQELNVSDTRNPTEWFRNNPTVIPYIVGLVTFLTMGIPGNILVITTVVTVKELRKDSNMLIVNLAVADLIICGMVDPFSLLGVMHGSSWFEDNMVFCEILAAVCLVSCYCSLLTIGFISVNRYMSICHPVRYMKIFTRKVTIASVAGLWIVSFILEIPNMVGIGGHVFDYKSLGCFWDRTASQGYTLMFSCAAVGGPLIMIVLCYLQIYIHVRKSKQRIASVNIKKSDLETLRERTEAIKLARTLCTIFVAFFLCWTPYALLVAIDMDDVITPEAHLYSILLAHGNSSINCIIYGVTNKTFRRGYMTILRCGYKEKKEQPHTNITT